MRCIVGVALGLVLVASPADAQSVQPRSDQDACSAALLAAPIETIEVPKGLRWESLEPGLVSQGWSGALAVDVEDGKTAWLTLVCSSSAELYMERLAEVVASTGLDTQIGVAIIGDGSFAVRDDDFVGETTVTWRHGEILGSVNTSTYGEGVLEIATLEAIAQAVDSVLP